MKTVVICGGGASGMMAALSAAEKKENKVLLLERQARVGRKLLATGNGRCNLTNTGASIEHYHGADPAFASFALKAYPPEEMLTFFRSLGLVCIETAVGRVYPLSDTAGSVLDVLRLALDAAGVQIHTGECVKQIQQRKRGFLVKTEEANYPADVLIIACGGRAGGKLGGVNDGYELLSALGHHRTALVPALVPIWTEPEIPRSLKGVRASATVELYRDKKQIAESTGEVQFVERGVSGPAIFDLSRSAVQGGELIMDFLSCLSVREVANLLAQRRTLSPEKENSIVFAGLLHSRLGLAVVKAAGFKPSGKIGDLSDEHLKKIAYTAKRLSLRITGTDTFENAQVTAGGMDVREFHAKTMESKLMPGVFACGEVLDIDGDCGGFNLHWAWASGRLAGRAGK